MRSMVEGVLLTPKNPSTALRAVPLPRKAGGGIRSRRFRQRLVLEQPVEQPVVEDPDRPALERRAAAGEPVAVGALDLVVEQPHQPVVPRAVKMASSRRCLR